MPLPAIVHWEGNHWIVLYDVDEQFVRVADPARGLRKIPRREFEAKWTGYAALFDYTPAFEEAPESKPTLAWVLPFLAKFKVILLQVLGLAVAVSFLQLLFPVFTQMVVDKVIVENDHRPAENHSAGHVRSAHSSFSSATLAQEYLLAFAAVRLDTAVLDFLEPETSVSADELFHESADGRHSAPARWRATGSAICRATGIGALLAVIFWWARSF